MIRSLLSDGQVWCLAVAEALVWAGFYYLFPALLLYWEGDFGWSNSELTLAMTVALLVSAVIAPRIGGWIDRDRGRWLLTGSATLGGILLLLLTQVETLPQFFAVWIGLGIAMGGSLYEPCFAHLTHRRGLSAKQAITLITLVAGFAGTISFPLSHILADVGGWRLAVGAFAGLILLVAVPLFWFGAGPSAKDAPVPLTLGGSEADQKSALRATLRNPVFWFLAASFAFLALNHGIVVTHFLPLLDERGVPSATAIVAISLLGPMQVVGRLAMLASERSVSMIVICGAIFIMFVAGGGILALTVAVPMLIYVFVMLQGAGNGIISITRPVVTALLLGRTGFGTISGAVALPFVAATAIGPSVGSMIRGWGGYDAVIHVLIALAVIGFICYLAAVALARRHPE